MEIIILFKHNCQNCQILLSECAYSSSGWGMFDLAVSTSHAPALKSGMEQSCCLCLFFG